MDNPNTSASTVPDQALWRYGIISEFLHEDPGGHTLAKRLDAAAQRLWNHPMGRQVRIKADTLRHWIYRYRKGGLHGLSDMVRRDHGSTEVPKVMQEEIRELRRQFPHHTTQRLLRKLVESGMWKGSKPSRTSIYRFVTTNHLGRVATGAAELREAHAFAYDEFGQMWVADFLHGPKIRAGRSLPKTYLFAIIDDASRYIVHARFYMSEGTEQMLDGLSLAVRCFGVPQKFYTDNGSSFRSDHLALVAGRMGMHLPHTPAYRPQGRGKIERFFRTVRDQWLPDGEVKSLDELNRMLMDWLDEYHHRIHDSLGCSPLEQRLRIVNATRPLPPVIDVERFFRMECKRRIAGNGTVRLLKKTFDVKNGIAGTDVLVSYLPWDLSQVYIGAEMVKALPVDLVRQAHRHEHNPVRGKELEVKP